MKADNWSQVSCQSFERDDHRLAARGTAFAPATKIKAGFACGSGVRFNIGRNEDTRVPGAERFVGLTDADRKVLSRWLSNAGARGIDMVADLSVRPWNVAGAGVIVGVFEANKPQASWLVIRSGSGWTLARCADGVVSEVSPSLRDILDLLDHEVGS